MGVLLVFFLLLLFYWYGCCITGPLWSSSYYPLSWQGIRFSGLTSWAWDIFLLFFFCCWKNLVNKVPKVKTVYHNAGYARKSHAQNKPQKNHYLQPTWPSGVPSMSLQCREIHAILQSGKSSSPFGITFTKEEIVQQSGWSWARMLLHALKLNRSPTMPSSQHPRFRFGRSLTHKVAI